MKKTIKMTTRKTVLALLVPLWALGSFAQETPQIEVKTRPDDYLEQIKKMEHLYDSSNTYDVTKNPKDLTPEDLLNIEGIENSEGLLAPKDQDKAFELIQKAANAGHVAAMYNLGRFYMIGAGCDIDFDQTLYWYTKAADAGNERAAYGLGYMYYKGFGVKQDYKKAVSWLELSAYAMAKCLLGECYQFGHGVVKNEDKAILNYTKSGTINANTMLQHILENVKATEDAKLLQTLKEAESPQNSAIALEVIQKTIQADPTPQKGIKPKYIDGKWKGKLVSFDWSGKEIESSIPVTCEFNVADDQITYTWTSNGVTTQNTAILEDNAIYYKDLNLVFNNPYSPNPKSNVENVQILSTGMQFKTINQKGYLIGNIQSFNNEFRESRQPMNLILKPADDNDDDFTAEELMALADQSEHFIVLYPNPFVEKVLIEYELEQPANVSVAVYGMSGNSANIALEPGANQEAGKHHYNLDGANLKPGMYIVKVTVAGEAHSRILIKQ